MRDYLQGETHLARFFEGSFDDPDSYLEKARELDGRFHRSGRERVAEMIRDPSEMARPGLERFVEEGGYLVTTGQQPGLFLGPMYSLYKALTAVRLAQALEPVVERPVLPLFWVGSEDHDWAEADHTHLLDRRNDLQTFRVPEQDGPPSRPLYRIPVESGLNETLDSFIETLPESDFSSSLFKSLRDAYPSGSTLSSGFVKVMEHLLGHLPILFVEAHDPGLKKASQPVLFRELKEAETHEALLHRTASHLEMEGYPPQVPILEGGVNLFFEGPAGRDRLYRNGTDFRLNHAGTVLSREELVERVHDDPSLLSPNVLLRPVVESALFPTLAYVAGPGELAYFAQLREFFRCHEIRMPIIFPRHSATLLEGKVEKVLDKFHLAVEGLSRPHHELAGEIAREELPSEIRQALGEIRGAVGKGAGVLARAAREVDPTLKGPVTHARNTSFAAFDEAEKKILQAMKRQNEIALGQLEKAQQNLFPLGRPQERVLNPNYYLARYGPELIQELLEEFRVALGPDPA